MIEGELYTRLTTHAGTAALVGTRVWPLVMPQGGKLPAIVYQKVSDVRVYSHDGDSDLIRSRFQVSCYAKNYDDVKALEAQVVDALSGYADRTLGTPVEASFMDMAFDDYEPDVKIYRVMVDFKVWHA